ncbi:bifunctional YncE family protein/alkaline phosphatase family protein [Neobacillus massiliamazoniensis]|uniref:40-residue YVTN family beta-propeller repeat-containing protein n=1 Tax=Neobacillus massiliamazoniensis TaxID=1499688 RepID=A0A0U1P3Q0_9BACI|nr:bifunctional YncE family protein/alkaline phosphatase family protein [Neobacillus massiliamazoniensis]CRK84994.1 40-residue YVTN family beta-propeller repeat-containing protein [Neobacillus massiliamazoniensis]
MLKKFRKKKKALLAGIALSTVVFGAVGTYAAQDGAFGSNLVGRQADGSVQTPVNQLITPAGKQIEFGGNPMSVAVNPNGKTAVTVVGRNNYGGKGINVVDLATGKMTVSDFDLGLSHMWGLAYSKDGSQLYATGSSGSTGKVVVMSIAADGTPTIKQKYNLPNAKVGGNINPLDLAVGPQGQLLVALNRDNSLGVMDPQTGKLTAKIPVENAPTSVLVDGNTAYVTNQGGRIAKSGDTTIDSSGSQVVVDPKTGATTTGTVSVVDLTTNTVTKNIEVGVQPERMTQSGQYIFVTNTNSDTVSVIDTKTNNVVQTIDVQPYPNAHKGAAPNAVKMIGNQLMVSLGRDNAVAVYDWNGPEKDPELKGLIPTAWFPVDLAIDSANKQLIVANGDGVGSLGPTRDLTIQGVKVTGHSAYAQMGSLSMIPFPSTNDLVKGTKQVYANNNWFGLKDLNAKPRNNKKPVAMPERIGEPSTIKHVFYIIKENRTYDQVLGDLGKGNGEPALVQFPKQVTPNFHKLAETYPNLDNFYVSGIQSASGHQWVMQGTNVDYEDKETDTANVRSYPGGAGDPMAYAPTGHLWDQAIKHGVSVENFGEDTTDFTGSAPFGTWTDWYNDSLILAGQKQGNLHVPIGNYQVKYDIPSLGPITHKTFPTFDMDIPDQYRFEIFKKQFEEHVKNDDLPQLNTLWVTNDHTNGSATGSPTPQAMVADNDLAVGKIVDLISHSKYWKDSVIFVTEDDSQNGLDHVDGHREPAYVISPYVKKEITNSHYWTVINMVRSIEQILGMQPMNQNDAAAEPMSELFTNKPDFTPYTFVPNQIPLNTLNGQPNANTAALANTQQITPQAQELSKQWTEWSNKNKDKMSGRGASPDKVNANMLNHSVWYATKGFDKPYPGENNVLTPEEVEKQPESSAPSPANN